MIVGLFGYLELRAPSALFDHSRGVDVLPQPVFARQDVGDVDPLPGELAFVDVPPPRRDALVHTRRVGLEPVAESLIRGYVVGVDGRRGTLFRFDVLVVLQAEPDLLRGCHFGGPGRVPKRVLGHVLQVPVVVAISVGVGHLRVAGFFDVWPLNVLFRQCR